VVENGVTVEADSAGSTGGTFPQSPPFPTRNALAKSTDSVFYVNWQTLVSAKQSVG